MNYYIECRLSFNVAILFDVVHEIVSITLSMSLSQIAEGAYNIIRQDLQEENHVYQQLESKGFSPFHLC